MSDIQRININKPIDNGGITFSWPSASKEGKNSEKETQNLSQTSRNLLNEYKLRNQPREELVFPTILYLNSSGDVELYQSNLPAPSKSNYSPKSTIPTGLSSNAKPQYMWTYNQKTYIASGGNIKILLPDYSVENVANSDYTILVSNIERGYIYLVLDNQIRQLDLNSNVVTTLSTIAEIAFPYSINSGIYDETNNRMILDVTPAAPVNYQSQILLLENTGNLFNFISQTDVPSIGSLYIQNNICYHYTLYYDAVSQLTYLRTHQINLTDNTVSYSDSTDLTGMKRLTNFDKKDIYVSPINKIYYKENLLGSIPSSIQINSIDIDNNILFGTQNATQNIYALNSLLENKIEILTQL